MDWDKFLERYRAVIDEEKEMVRLTKMVEEVRKEVREE